ncbi:MAG: hypothetical protein FWC16_03405 [Defluviitaleaceae bacterium]|nr:hypothetical protein [Defluviitaleaceae bacterium]MCL2273949.1 hypothetical protein [Defluviitaleaceae bacterium]
MIKTIVLITIIAFIALVPIQTQAITNWCLTGAYRECDCITDQIPIPPINNPCEACNYTPIDLTQTNEHLQAIINELQILTATYSQIEELKENQIAINMKIQLITVTLLVSFIILALVGIIKFIYYSYIQPWLEPCC